MFLSVIAALPLWGRYGDHFMERNPKLEGNPKNFGVVSPTVRPRTFRSARSLRASRENVRGSGVFGGSSGAGYVPGLELGHTFE